MERLQHHELDLVLAFKPTQPDEHVESQVLFRTRLAAVMGECHPMAHRKLISLKELEPYSLALPAVGLQARHAFEKVINGCDLSLKIKAEINNVNLLFKLIRQSTYITILAQSAVVGENGLKAIPTESPLGYMEGCIHTLHNSYTKHAAREFIRMLSTPATLWKDITLPNE